MATVNSATEFYVGPYAFNNGNFVIKQFSIKVSGNMKNVTVLSASVKQSTVVCDHIKIDIAQDRLSGVKNKSVGLLINQSSQSILILSDIVFTKFPQTSSEQQGLSYLFNTVDSSSSVSIKDMTIKDVSMEFTKL